MRILITGAGGFIGANLCRAFPDDDVHAFVRAKNVWRLARAPVTLHEGEITDAASVDAVVEDVRPNAVFHFAQYGGNRDEKDEK
jgi:nucleoside-diphosphate-sugar epimerase